MSHRAQEKENVSPSVRFNSAGDTILEDTVHLLCRVVYACSTLQEKCLLFHKILTYSIQKRPHGWVVAVKQGLQSMVPPLDRICCASYSCGGCIMLIPQVYSEQWLPIRFNSTPKT